MLNLDNYKKEKIEGAHGELVRLTNDNIEIIGGTSGSGKSHYIMNLIGELSESKKDVKVLTNEDDAAGYLKRAIDVNVDVDLNEDITAQFINNRGEDVDGLIEKIVNDSKNHDVIIVDAVHGRVLDEIVSGLEDIENKKFIFAVQLNREMAKDLAM